MLYVIYFIYLQSLIYKYIKTLHPWEQYFQVQIFIACKNYKLTF